MTEEKSVEQTKEKSKGLPLPMILGLGCLGILVLGGTVVGAAFRFFGPKIAETVVKKGFEAKTGVKVDGITNGEGISFTDGKTGQKLNIGSQKIPDNFPKDFPLYPDAKPVTSGSGSENGGETGFWLMLTSTDSVTKVVQYYETNLKSKGWTIDNTYAMGDTTTWTVSKGKLKGTVAIARGEGDKETILTIALVPQEQTPSESPEATPEE